MFEGYAECARGLRGVGHFLAEYGFSPALALQGNAQGCERPCGQTLEPAIEAGLRTALDDAIEFEAIR